MNWFEVDKAGLAALLEGRGKSFALFELISNACDAGAFNVDVRIEAVSGQPLATLSVEDDSPEGWVNLAEAFTMFGKSRRAGEAEKRGRFCLGEKLVLALCRDAKIVTMAGSVTFTESGRRNSSEKRELGTLFVGTIRMTRDELADVEIAVGRMIPPADVTIMFNGSPLARPKPLKTFVAKLPTVTKDDEGNLRPGVRNTTVEAFASDEGGEVLEMGIPVCAADWPWRLNVLQKVPLNMERDHVTDGFRRALQVAATNALAETISIEQSAEPWCEEASADSRIQKDAMSAILDKRFGERRVVAVPGDPLANANAAATGVTLIHGGSLPAGAHANMRKFGLTPTASQAFPSPRPSVHGEAIKVCPLCKQQVNA